MQCSLLVSSADKSRKQLEDLVQSTGSQIICCAKNSGEARRMMLEQDFSLIVINTPLKDEFGHDFAMVAAEKSLAGVLLLVKSEQADEVAARVEDSGVVVVPKPVSRQFFYQAHKLVVASHRRMMGIQRENDKLQHQIEEIRLVNRAKCVLIERLSMSEAQAHRYVEKQAMNMRTTRAEIAREVLKTYE